MRSIMSGSSGFKLEGKKTIINMESVHNYLSSDHLFTSHTYSFRSFWSVSLPGKEDHGSDVRATGDKAEISED